jgi:parallel beta-helix repeat protein
LHPFKHMKKRYTFFTGNFISMFFSISCAFLSISTCLGAAYNVNSLGDANAGAGLNGDLRYCINQANAAAGAHTITFSVSGPINLTSTLPTFTKQISVTATIGNIVLNGGGIVNWVFFFNNAGANGSVLDGLVINRAGTNFPNIELNGVSNITIQNCYIGTDATGNAAAASSNFFGIYFVTATNNFITNNVISGHTQHGMALVSSSSGNTIRGNKIGCNRLGTAAIPNAFSGIEINGSINNIIGGAAVADRNIISGNTLSGVSLVSASTGTQIINNYIGINTAGTGALGNKEHGIKIDASANTIVTNNVICASGNTAPVVFGFGLHIINSNGHTIRGNKVGVNAAGTAAVANNYIGLRVENCNNVIIGGATAGQGNTLSGNGEEGALLINCGNPSIKGNFIGTNSTGAAAIPNGRSGLHIQGATTPAIGGTAAGEPNVISGNSWDGIQLENATDATIQGNFIGTNATGTAAIGNGSNGISGYTNSTNNLIGGTAAAARNIISCNGVDGIHYDGITTACNNLLIKNNYIGTNASGAGAAATFGNGKSGVVVLNNCLGLVIGGTMATERNIISGNGRLWGGVGNGTGIVINGGCTSAQITGNYIGLAVDGTTAMGNAENGIVVLSSNSVLIGGSTTTTQNIVSSNGYQGIVMQSCDLPVVIGNYCGTDITGTLARGNGQSGVIFIFVTNGKIGRANANEGNILSNNSEEGIHLVGGSNNIIYNNLIGVAIDKTTNMGNKTGGVYILGVAGAPNGNNNTVGGLGALQPNIIAYSKNTGANPALGNGFGVGVAATDFTQGTNNTIIGNKIFCNVGMGIDLNFGSAFGGGNGTGNGGKAAPAITAVTTTSTSGTGTNGETIHVYSNVTCTTCQGETYLGSATVAGGVWTVTHVAVAAPFNNSATATNNTQGTSQFACNFTLPVELLSFKAQAKGSTALLTWATAMEKNNAAFVIERSKDGKTFEAIGSKTGQGSTLQTTHYDFTDENPNSAVIYYRLKQVDFDGTQTYSAIQVVYFESSDDVHLFPNPATDELNIVLSSDELYDIHVYSNLGVEVQHLSTTQQNNTYTIRLNGVASGSYIIVLSSANKQITKQFLVY